MDKLPQGYILTTAFGFGLDMEELLIRKCNHYYGEVKDENLKSLIKDIKKQSQEHVKHMKEKMLKLDIKV